MTAGAMVFQETSEPSEPRKTNRLYEFIPGECRSCFLSIVRFRMKGEFPLRIFGTTGQPIYIACVKDSGLTLHQKIAEEQHSQGLVVH